MRSKDMRLWQRDWESRAALRLQSAATIEEYWAATQKLVTSAAPSSSRLLCLRPLRMASAMLLLRETTSGTRRERRGRDDDDSLLRLLFNHHPAVLHFRSNLRASLVHLGRQKFRSLTDNHDLPSSRWEFGSALAFWRRNRLEGLLLLHRTSAEGDFTAEELQRLRELQPHLEAALGRIIGHRRQLAHKRALANILGPLPLPMVICDHKLKVITETAEGLAARAVWAAGDRDARKLKASRKMPLPDDLAEFCRAKMRAWEKSDSLQRLSLEKEELELAHPVLAHLGVHLRLFRQKGFPLVKPLFVLRFQSRASASFADQQTPPENFASLTELSSAERELARLICRGHGNAAVARHLGKSIHTVKAQLQSIFVKLRVRGRGKLIAHLMSKTAALVPLTPFGLGDFLAVVF